MNVQCLTEPWKRYLNSEKALNIIILILVKLYMYFCDPTELCEPKPQRLEIYKIFEVSIMSNQS